MNNMLNKAVVLILGVGLFACSGVEGDVDGGVCTVTSNENGSATITCPDGSEAIVAGGRDGSSCTARENDDATYTISCDDGTEVVVSDGQDGVEGAVGSVSGEVRCVFVDDSGEEGVTSCPESVRVRIDGQSYSLNEDSSFAIHDVPMGFHELAVFLEGSEATTNIEGELADIPTEALPSDYVVSLWVGEFPEPFVVPNIGILPDSVNHLGEITLKSTYRRVVASVQEDGSFRIPDIRGGQYRGGLPIQPQQGRGYYSMEMGTINFHAFAQMFESCEVVDGCFRGPSEMSDPIWNIGEPLVLDHDSVEIEPLELFPFFRARTLITLDSSDSGLSLCEGKAVAADLDQADIILGPREADGFTVMSEYGEIYEVVEQAFPSLSAVVDGEVLPSNDVRFDDSTFSQLLVRDFRRSYLGVDRNNAPFKFKLLPAATGSQGGESFVEVIVLYDCGESGASQF